MPYVDFTVPSSYDGLEIHCRTYKVSPGRDLKARVVFVHGFSEFVEAYDEWFPPICDAGYEVTLYDARGHGHTATSQSDFGKSNELGVMGDLEAVIEHTIKANTDSKPLVLWGFSMGGGIVLNYMIIGEHRTDFAMYVATGPMILRHKSLMSGMAGFKSRLLPYILPIAPNYREQVKIAPELVNNNPERHKQYPNEPLRHYTTSVSLMHHAIRRGERLLDPSFNSRIVDRPLLINHGTADVLCDFEASKSFIDAVQLTDKTLELYSDKPHELMQNVKEDVEEHRTKVLEWLNAHLPK